MRAIFHCRIGCDKTSASDDRSSRCKTLTSGAIEILSLILFVASLFPFSVSLLHAKPSYNPLYAFDVIAKTGDENGLVSFEKFPSINDNGTVAFIGHLVGGGSSVFVGDGNNANPTNITPAWINPEVWFRGGVQINNWGHVAAVEGHSGPSFLLRFWGWDPVSNPSGATIVRGSEPIGSAYEYIGMYPSINNTLGLEWVGFPGGNDDGKCDPGEACLPQVVFSGFMGVTTYLSTPYRLPENIQDPGHFKKKGFGIINDELRPMIADDGTIVLREGDKPNDPIRIYDHTLDFSSTIADTNMGFDALGKSPGISDDGIAVAFAGRKANEQGDGIWASFWNAKNAKWEMIQIAGIPGELGRDDSFPSQPLYLKTIEVDSRVAVIHQRLGGQSPLNIGDSFVVAFIGTPNQKSSDRFFTPGIEFAATTGLWTVQVDVIEDIKSPGSFIYKPRRPMPVVQEGDLPSDIKGVTKKVRRISIYDPLAQIVNLEENLPPNSLIVTPNGSLTWNGKRYLMAGSHQIAFFLETEDNNQYIVRGTHRYSCVLPVKRYRQISEELWSPFQLDSHIMFQSEWTQNDPTAGTIGARGCALSTLAMQLTYYSDQKIAKLDEFNPGTLNNFLMDYKAQKPFVLNADLVPSNAVEVIWKNKPRCCIKM